MEETDRQRWDVHGTLAYIEQQCAKVVALQFPDELLAESSTVYHQLCCELAGKSVEVCIHCSECLIIPRKPRLRLHQAQQCGATRCSSTPLRMHSATSPSSKSACACIHEDC